MFPVAGYVTDLSPIPQSIPEVVVLEFVGTGLPEPILLRLAVSAHLLYRGPLGTLLAISTDKPTSTKRVDFGVVL